MPQIRTAHVEPRRLVLPLVAVAVAGAVVAAFVIEPSSTIAPHPKQSTAKLGRSVRSALPAQAGQETEAGPAPSSTVIEARDAKSDAADASTIAPGGVAASDEIGAGVVGDGTGEASLPTLGIKVIQTGSLAVRVKRGTLDERLDRATEIATALGGYVVDLQLSDGATRNADEGTVTIRVPGQRFSLAMRQLAAMGAVKHRQVSSSDVTQEYVDTKSRLRHDEAVETRLLRLLERAKSVNDVLVVQDRLDAVQQEIEIEKGRISYLDKMTELATISVTLRERGVASTHRRQGGIEWGLGRALRTGVERFAGNVGAAIVWLGGALPTLLLLGAIGLVGRRIVRSRTTRSGIGAGAAGHDDAHAPQ